MLHDLSQVVLPSRFVVEVDVALPQVVVHSDRHLALPVVRQVLVTPQVLQQQCLTLLQATAVEQADTRSTDTLTADLESRLRHQIRLLVETELEQNLRNEVTLTRLVIGGIFL